MIQLLGKKGLELIELRESILKLIDLKMSKEAEILKQNIENGNVLKAIEQKKTEDKFISILLDEGYGMTKDERYEKEVLKRRVKFEEVLAKSLKDAGINNDYTLEVTGHDITVIFKYGITKASYNEKTTLKFPDMKDKITDATVSRVKNIIMFLNPILENIDNKLREVFKKDDNVRISTNYDNTFSLNGLEKANEKWGKISSKSFNGRFIVNRQISFTIKDSKFRSYKRKVEAATFFLTMVNQIVDEYKVF